MIETSRGSRLARICSYCGNVEADYNGGFTEPCRACGKVMNVLKTGRGAYIVPKGCTVIGDERALDAGDYCECLEKQAGQEAAGPFDGSHDTEVGRSNG